VKLDAVPEATGGRALRIVVCDALIKVLPAVVVLLAPTAENACSLMTIQGICT
jgi:hypothetical protein